MSAFHSHWPSIILPTSKTNVHLKSSPQPHQTTPLNHCHIASPKISTNHSSQLESKDLPYNVLMALRTPLLMREIWWKSKMTPSFLFYKLNTDLNFCQPQEQPCTRYNIRTVHTLMSIGIKIIYSSLKTRCILREKIPQLT